MTNAEKRFLSPTTAKALVEQGLKLTPHYSYITHEIYEGSAALVHTDCVGQWIERDKEARHYPACTFEELWPLLPYTLRINSLNCGLHLQGSNYGQYIAQYYYYPTMRSQLEGDLTAITPVEAAGTLLLRLLKNGLVTADQINQVQERLNTNE